MLQELYKAWRRNRSVMVQMPTGTGKTHLMAAVIRSLTPSPIPAEAPTRSLSPKGEGSSYQGGGVLVVAHRRELIEQIAQTLDAFGIEHGLIVSGKETNFSKKVQVASIQTLTRRISHTDCTNCTDSTASSLNTNGHELTTNSPKRRNSIAAEANSSLLTYNFSLIIVDEAHHALADTYRVLWERWPRARFLGLTATPCRLNNAPFTDLFQKLLQSWPIQEFIDKGWLSDFEYVSASPDSEAMRKIRQLRKRGADGDYQTAEMATVMDVPESIEHLYRTYRQFAGGKKGIVYAIDRQHAQHIAEYYREQGVRCAVIDAKTTAVERKRIIEEYKAPPTAPEGASIVSLPEGAIVPPSGGEGGALSVLINVDIFSEGFDCPEVEFIQLARPTLSLSKYLQQVGRGMRVSPGKPHVLILDQVGLYQTFGLPTEGRDWRQTFYGLASGRGMRDGSRMVVVDEQGTADSLRRELVNLQMVRIKKGGRRHVGLEIFLQDGRYGVRNNGRVSCEARFKEIVRLRDPGGFFAVGIYGGRSRGEYVEYASLIDRKGVDLQLRLFRDVSWKDGIYYSCYKPKDYQEGGWFRFIYWDPKGNCYYDWDPEFRTVAGVEVAWARDHSNDSLMCLKFRVTTGNLSPRFRWRDVFYNKHIIIARDYLVVKRDRNHAYRICGYWNDTVIVQDDDRAGYLQVMLDGRKGKVFRTLPDKLKRISPISYIYYLRDLKMQCLWKNPPRFAE